MRTRIRAHRPLLAVVLITALIGCDDPPKQREGATSGPNGTIISVDGVQFIFAGQNRNQNIHNDVVTFEDDDGRKYKIKGRELFVDGKSTGKFENGDVVKINADGSIAVNDAPPR